MTTTTMTTTKMTTTTTNMTTTTRKFQVRLALGGYGSEHRTLPAAIRAMEKAERAARRGGDRQGFYIQVNEYRAGSFYGHGELTDAESTQIGS